MPKINLSQLKSFETPERELVTPPALTKEQRTALEKQRIAEAQQLIEAERVYRAGVVSILDLVAPASLKVTANYLELGGKFVRTIFVVSYPRYISVGWFAPIINLNVALDIGMFFYPIDTDIILKQLKNKVGTLEAQILSDAEKGAPRDPVRETALRDIEKLRDDLTQTTEKFFQYALYVTAYASTLEELDVVTERVEAIFGSKLVYSKRVLFQAEQGFNATLPLANDELGIAFNMNSSPAASSFPFISSELTSDNGILYGINRHNNSLILFDRFSLQNANTVVFATSGAGKSYAVKLEVLRSLMLGTDVIIIDPEREYKYLSDSVGGSYINISLNSDNKINPFDLPRAVGEDEKPADIIRSAVITLKGLLRLMLGELTHEEDSIIDRALIEAYAKKDITPDSDLATVEPPLMKDLEDVLGGMQGGEDLVIRLKKYTEGTFAGLFNSPTNIEMNNQLVVFSVRDLEDELRPIAISTIISYIWSVVRSQLKKRILVIDEAWWLMQYEDSAKFIYALVKRCRKYYLGVTTITQDVNDFLRSPYGQAIVNNSALQLLLKQSPAGIDILSKTFLLTQGEKYLLLDSGVGEGIFFAGAKHAAIRIVASYTEDQLITSDPSQLLEIEAAKKEFEASLASEPSPIGAARPRETMRSAPEPQPHIPEP
ncbi:MAG: ATP-binding protein [Candidatus Kerfeldbacteria bacterium]|nr:ATP-binding protein [Candidatus Kerfeldbacteria bacterium]